PRRRTCARQRARVWNRVRDRRQFSRHRLRGDSPDHSRHPSAHARGDRDHMKITGIRTRVVEWRGPTVPPQPHFCTNAMDVLTLPADSMAGFRVHGWLIVEVFTDAGHDVLGKAAGQPVFRLLGGRTKPRIPVYASRLYSQPLDALAAEAAKYKNEGYQAMKLRFGWGPADGAAGMQQNLALVRTVREVVGDEVDIMADAYMGWNLDYAKRMIPLLEQFHLRWLEEPVIPDDMNGYAELRKMHRIPIAGGEHAFTVHE